MTIESLTVVGVSSTRPDAFANRVVEKARREGIKVFAINPKMRSMEVRVGEEKYKTMPVYASINDVPESTQYVALYIPRGKIDEDLMREISMRGYAKIIVPPPPNVEDINIESGQRIRELGIRHKFLEEDILIDACFLRGDIE